MVADVTGWNQLMNGTVVSAVYEAYNTPLGGYLLLLLFVVISAIIILNAGVEVAFIIGIIFFGAFNSWLNDGSFYVILTILAVELTGVFYNLLVKT